jgi:hypothetical protein
VFLILTLFKHYKLSKLNAKLYICVIHTVVLLQNFIKCITPNRKLHNEELNDLYSLPNILRVVKSRILRWVGNVARMG